ncbi:unnamed protein product [Fusarium equiseti]|uniref:Uncharacterized protein n=1 Tax=Fusarium equiseti TaxID=61235 RepID=A0A8J2IIT9_FUSEQ|nr:unnamed protein product [Fusarium equiseti]
MSGSASNLSSPQYGYDVVVAVTQASINATLRQYLSTVQAPVINICYVLDANGNPTQIGYEQLMSSSNGTDPFTVPTGADPNGAHVQNLMKARFVAGFKAQLGLPQVPDGASLPDIVTLTSDISNVQFNMLCSEFVICELSGLYSAPSFASMSQPSGSLWCMQATVNLSLSTMEASGFSSLPPAIKAQIMSMDGTGFSIQQLLFDLNSVKLAKPPTIPNLSPTSQPSQLLEQCFTGAYFSAMQTGGLPLLGCSIVPPMGNPSSLTMTDMNVMVNPYVGTSGEPQSNPSDLQQSLSTLNYLCAVDNDKLPPNVQFGWNWLEASDLSTSDGILAMNRNCLRNYFVERLRSYIPTVCFKVNAHCDTDFLSCNMSVDLSAGGQPTLDEAAGATVLSYSYNASDSDQAGNEGQLGQLRVGSAFNMTVQFVNSNGNATVIITQHLVINCDVKIKLTQAAGNLVDKTVIDTYTLAVDNNGKLGVTLDMVMSDNSDTTTMGVFQDFFTGSDEVTGVIKAQGEALASTNIHDIPLSTMQDYVFPGGQIFTFKDSRFSENQDLLSSITYVDPTSSPPTVMVSIPWCGNTEFEWYIWAVNEMKAVHQVG